MLKFFRTICANGDPAERKGRFWIYALAEFALVVLGLVLVLQIENWNQNRQDRKLEHILLEEMQTNLRNDLKDANLNVRYHQRYLQSNEIVLDYLDGKFPYHDSLEYHFGHIVGATLFEENTSAYQSLKSIGIDLISNDSLRQKMTYLYEARYDYIHSIGDAVLLTNNSQVTVQIAKHLYSIEHMQSARPLDPLALKKDNEFRTVIMLNISLIGYQLYSYNVAIPLMEDIIENIEI